MSKEAMNYRLKNRISDIQNATSAEDIIRIVDNEKKENIRVLKAEYESLTQLKDRIENPDKNLAQKIIDFFTSRVDGDLKKSYSNRIDILQKTIRNNIKALQNNNDYYAIASTYQHNYIVEKIAKNYQEISDLSKILNADIATSNKIFEKTDNIYNTLLADNATQPTTPIAKNEKKEDAETIKTTPSGGTYNPNDYKSVNQNEKRSLEQFIADNQDNRMYEKEVESAKNRVKAIDAEFKIFDNAKTKQELKSYTKNYPNGIWKTEANYKIADIDLKSLGSNPIMSPEKQTT